MGEKFLILFVYFCLLWLINGIYKRISILEEKVNELNEKTITWNSVKDKSIVLPSKNTTILVTDGENVNVMSVAAFLKNVDKPYNRWTHWAEINSLKTLKK